MQTFLVNSLIRFYPTMPANTLRSHTITLKQNQADVRNLNFGMAAKVVGHPWVAIGDSLGSTVQSGSRTC